MLSIPFSGLIDPTSVNSQDVFFLKLDNGNRGQMVGINEIVWDTTNFPYSLRVTADEVLEQHTRYALIVTRGVRDASGTTPVEPSPAFEDFRHDLNFGQSQ